MDWARAIRGTSSIEKAVTPALHIASVVSEGA